MPPFKPVSRGVLLAHSEPLLHRIGFLLIHRQLPAPLDVYPVQQVLTPV